MAVRVLLASIMYPDNAVAFLYQQLTGEPTHTEEDGELGGEHMRLQSTKTGDGET